MFRGQPQGLARSLLFPARNRLDHSGVDKQLSLIQEIPLPLRLRAPRQSLWEQPVKQMLSPREHQGPVKTGGTVPGTTTGTSPLTPIPGTESIGSFGSGQTIVTNPGNPFTVATPGTTSIVVGQTGETNAITPGTSGSGQTGTVPGTTTGTSPLATPISGTESVGSFGSGQTIVTNPGNPITVAPPGTTTIVIGQTG